MDNAYMQYIVVVIDNGAEWPETSRYIIYTQGGSVTSALRGPDAVPATLFIHACSRSKHAARVWVGINTQNCVCLEGEMGQLFRMYNSRR